MIFKCNIIMRDDFVVQVIAENTRGLLFKNKKDRKILNVDPKASF